MKLGNTLLFVIPALIWGSTWFVIKFQLGEVDPSLSVGYRFIAAGLILLAYCKIRSIDLIFSLKTHAWIALQGSLLFCFNYWLVYIAEQELNSALMAVLFGFVMFMNILFSRIFMGTKTPGIVYLGASLGLIGTYLIFYQQLKELTFAELPIKSTVIGFLSVVFASLGNVSSAANQRRNIPVISSTGFGMIYGGLIMFMVALISGAPFIFDFSPNYIASMLYLTIFGSIIAFSTYLTLIGKIGPGRAAYVLVTIPVIAIIISTFYEGYNFNVVTLLGIGLIVGGNITIIKR